MKEEKEHLLSRGGTMNGADYSADDESTGVYTPSPSSSSMQRHQNFLSPTSTSNMLGLLPASHAKLLTRSSSSAALTISTSINYPGGNGTASSNPNSSSMTTSAAAASQSAAATPVGMATLKKIRAKLSSSSLAKRDNDPLSHDFTRYFNMRNAKLIAVLLITLFVFYHGSLNSFYGRNSCNRLLGEGHLTDDSEWQPFGCMIHKYSKNDIQMCYKYYKYFNEKNSFVFIGDMRTRQVYHAFIKQFDKDYKLTSVKTESFETAIQDYLAGSNNNNNYSHLNSNYTDKSLDLEISFFWKPFLDESVNNMIESYLQPTGSKPNFIVLGTAIPYFYLNSSKKALDWFKGNMTNLVDTIKSLNYDYKYPLLKKEKALSSKQRMRTLSNSGGGTAARQTQTPDSAGNGETSSTSSSSSSSSAAGSSSTSETSAAQSPHRDSAETTASIYWMLQDPMDEYKYFLNRNYSEKITNRKIDMFNRESINLLYRSPISTWSSARLVSQAYSKDSPDGLEIGPFALDIDSQILYNLYCNNRMNFNDASCCSQPESISLIQLVLFCIYLVIFLLTFVLVVYKNSCKTYSNFRVNISGKEIGLTTTCKNAASSSTFYKFLKLFSKLALIMFYFFACDRANYFMKENKHYTLLTFLIPLLYITVIGLFFHDNLPSAKVMNKYQTYELKGLMQIVILLYKMSNAQQSTPLYLLMSLFTSAYLFLSGYGHFMHFWNSSSFQITRFFEVIFRLNFLPIMLCFTMNRMYQFYSFIPLITFWFVASYLLMIMYPRVSARTAKDNYYHYFYMIIKLGVFLGLISLLNFSESIFERVFLARLWKFLFVSSDDLIDEWRSRWTHDCYSFALGMCFAHLICILKRLNLIDESSSLDTTSSSNAHSATNNNSPNGGGGGGGAGGGGLTANSDNNSDSIKLINTGANSGGSGSDSITNMEIMEFSDNRRKTNSIWNIKIKFILIFMSMCGLASYLMLIILCQSRDICDNIMAYLTVIPIVSYFVLRNSIQCLSDKCSFMFVWFGRLAMELYVCSYHIWSAADSNGMLVILPGYPVVNVLLTTFIFICLSHELNGITRELGEIIMPRDNWRVCVRNALAFIILLMPVAIKYGYI